MDPSTVRVPDGIEPLVGYRCWSYTITPDGASLLPLSLVGSSSSLKSSWAGAESRWVEARCIGEPARPFRSPSQILRDILVMDPAEPTFSSPPHEVPVEACSCGFYAMRDLVPEFVDCTSWSLGHGQMDVLGRVLLSGKVIEHTEGYRAQYARIAELIPVKGTERTVACLAAALGLPMGAPV